MLDIAISVFIGIILIVMIFQLNTDMSLRNVENTLYLITQQNGSFLKELIESDLKKAGVGMPDSSTVITIAEPGRIQFRHDLDFDGTFETVTIYAGDVTSASFTENPNDVIFYRQIDGGTPLDYTIGLRRLSFRYFSATGNETAVLRNIRQIEYSVYVENTIGLGGDFSGIFIRNRVKPKNMG